MVSQDYWCVITDLVLVTKAVISPPIWKQRRDYCSIFKMLYSSEQSPFLSTHIKALTALCIFKVGIQCFATTAQIIFVCLSCFQGNSRKILLLCLFGRKRVSSHNAMSICLLSNFLLWPWRVSSTLSLYSFYLFYQYANYHINSCQVERLEIPGWSTQIQYCAKEGGNFCCLWLIINHLVV